MNFFVVTVVFIIFVSSVSGQIEVNQDLIEASCPVSTPIRCPNSVCVASISNCPVNNCTGLLPFLCSDGTCAISSIYCNCQGVVCADGSCKTSISLCPLLDSCPELLPQRCPDGSCEAWNGTCLNHTGTDCPSGLQLCIDGICRTPELCLELPYSGCPSFECSTGACTTNYSTCLCPTDPTKVECFDGSCVRLDTLCASTAPAFINPMNVTITLNTSLSSAVTVPSASNISHQVVTVTLPAGSVDGVSSNVSLNTLSVSGVSSSATVNSTILDSSGNITAAKVISTPISVSFGSGQTVMNTPVVLSFPTVVSTDTNVCVAVLEANGTWTCASSTTVETTGSNLLTVSANVSHFSTYAVVKVPVCFPSGAVAGPAFCATQTWESGMEVAYFCANNGHSFYMCLGGDLAILSNIQACPAGTKCSCCEGIECSDNNTESPCRF